MELHLDSFFFFNDTATTEIYTLSLHDALPICCRAQNRGRASGRSDPFRAKGSQRSEEHTSELQSRLHLVCRLLLEKKKTRAQVVAVAAGPLSDCARTAT